MANSKSAKAISPAISPAQESEGAAAGGSWLASEIGLAVIKVTEDGRRLS
jgi:hypothetical protein